MKNQYIAPATQAITITPTSMIMAGSITPTNNLRINGGYISTGNADNAV